MQILLRVLNYKFVYNSLSTIHNFDIVLNKDNARLIYNECVRIKSGLCKGHKYNILLNKLMRKITNEYL